MAEKSVHNRVNFTSCYHRLPLLIPYRVSLFYLVGLFDLWDGLRSLLWGSVGAYAIAAYIDSPFMPWIGFVFMMGHMSINHINRQILNDPGVIDVTGL